MRSGDHLGGPVWTRSSQNGAILGWRARRAAPLPNQRGFGSPSFRFPAYPSTPISRPATVSRQVPDSQADRSRATGTPATDTTGGRHVGTTRDFPMSRGRGRWSDAPRTWVRRGTRRERQWTGGQSTPIGSRLGVSRGRGDLPRPGQGPATVLEGYTLRLAPRCGGPSRTVRPVVVWPRHPIPYSFRFAA